MIFKITGHVYDINIQTATAFSSESYRLAYTIVFCRHRRNIRHAIMTEWQRRNACLRNIMTKWQRWNACLREANNLLNICEHLNIELLK